MRRALLALLLLAPACGRGPSSSLVYKDATQPVDARVADLLARMTPEEKVAQTLGIWKGKEKITTDEGVFDPAKAKDVLGNGIGEIARPSEMRDNPKKVLLGPRENAV